MIVDTDTGEVLNPRIINADSRIVSHYYSHRHHHDHFHTYERRARNNAGSIRRHGMSIFIIFALIILFLNYTNQLGLTQRDFSFYGLLSYFGDSDNFVDVGFLNFFERNNWATLGASLSEAAAYRIPEDSIFSFLNHLLELTSPVINILSTVVLVLNFIADCCYTLINLVLTIITFIFGI